MRSTKSQMPLLAILVATLAASGCASVRTSHVSDPRYDFAGRSTYRWAEASGGSEELGFADRSVREAIGAALQARGWRQVADGPELEVAYRLGRDQITQVTRYWGGSAVGYGWPYWPGWGPGPYGGWWGPAPWGAQVRHLEEGSLTVDFLDVESGEVVWRGTAREALASRMDPAEQDRRVRNAVEKLLEGFPPPR